jgi:hypothetical protein
MAYLSYFSKTLYIRTQNRKVEVLGEFERLKVKNYERYRYA